MLVFICILVYIIIVSVSIFGLIVAARYADLDTSDCFEWVLAGIFWPVTLLPCAGYIAARWYLNNH